MADLKEARVPDIGDYSDVPVIEILVAVGDTVVKDQGLLTLESDKATLEVPAPFAGVIKELKVKLGDSLSEGAVVAMIEAADGDAAQPAAAAPAPAAKAEVSSAETGAKVEPVAVAAQPDKIAQREIAQEQSAPAAAAASPQVVDSKPGLDPEASPPQSPPVE
ncbi:MAG: biotin/lipoyl-containing protein, partial [Pseudoxanthomonas sp.]